MKTTLLPARPAIAGATALLLAALTGCQTTSPEAPPTAGSTPAGVPAPARARADAAPATTQEIARANRAARAAQAPVFGYIGRRGFGSSGIDVAPGDEDLLQVSGSDDVDAKEELLRIPTLAARESETGPRAFGSSSMPTQWRPAKALMALRAQLKALAPNRATGHDGMVGDRAHWLRGVKSDHNPWVRDGSSHGVVTAYDVTDNPAGGCNVQKLVDSLVQSRDGRIKYIIWKSRIINRDAVGGVGAWTWRRYTGSNPHDKHMHLSVLPTSSRYDDTQPWNIAVR